MSGRPSKSGHRMGTRAVRAATWTALTALVLGCASPDRDDRAASTAPRANDESPTPFIARGTRVQT